MFIILNCSNVSAFPQEILAEDIYEELEIQCEYKEYDLLNISNRDKRINIGEIEKCDIDKFYSLDIGDGQNYVKLVEDIVVYRLKNSDFIKPVIEECLVSDLKKNDLLFDAASYTLYLEKDLENETNIKNLEAAMVILHDIKLQKTTEEYALEVYLYKDEKIKSVFIDSIMIKNNFI